MDLSFTDEQQMLAHTVREMCASTYGSDVIREGEDGPGVFPPALQKNFADAGLAGLTLPTEYGGAAAGLVEMAIVAEELGRAAAPLTPIVSSLLCGGLIVRCGTDEQLRTWLPRLAAGSVLATAAWLEPGGGYRRDDVQLAAHAVADMVAIRGTKTHVPYADHADVFVVPLRRTDTGDIEIYLVPPGAGISTAPQHTLAGELLYAVTFDSTVPASARLGEPRACWPALEDTMDNVACAIAAYAVGGAKRALEMATAYAKDRHQFGRPLGSFQAIAHRLADDLVAVEGAAALAYEAAWTADQNRDARILAAMAKQRCTQVFRDVTASAHQVLGGIGFTLDVDLQLYFRRAKQLQLLWWDDRHLTDHLAQLLLDESGPGLLPPLIER